MNEETNITNEQLENIIEKIKKDYFLVKQRNLFYFLGGAVTFMITVAGLTIYHINTQIRAQVTAAVEQEISPKMTEMIQPIEDTKTEAKVLLDNIKSINQDAVTASSSLSSFLSVDRSIKELIVEFNSMKEKVEEFDEFYNVYNTSNGDSYAEIRYPRIKFITGNQGEGEVIINGKLRIQNGNIKVGTQEVQLKPQVR